MKDSSNHISHSLTVAVFIQRIFYKTASKPCLLAIAITSIAGNAVAHTSEQGFVLLLPTDAYILSGVTVVVLTLLATVLLPVALIEKGFAPRYLLSLRATGRIKHHFTTVASLLSLCCLIALIIIGFVGTHDPLRNLLPLTIWTVWWVGIVCIHGVFGNLWQWFNPWVGIFHKRKVAGLTLPTALESWPGVFMFLFFSTFALADTAPEDPTRLAVVVAVYAVITLAGVWWCGATHWLTRVDCFSMLLWRFAQVAPLGIAHGSLAIGAPGWKLATCQFNDSHTKANQTISGAVFTLALLAAGSFDGLNETFWWLVKIGINPLEFPGRTAVVTPTVFGLLVSVAALVASFAICVAAGLWLANRHTDHGREVAFRQAFIDLSVAILPIALAYHFAHFLTAFMVNIQYTLAAATDPLQTGRDLLGLGRFYVTTGFFNTQSSVRQIWLTQAGTVVAGHVVSLLLAHRIALNLWSRPAAAALSQLPLATFMVFYTLLGLWLLAAPRGA